MDYDLYRVFKTLHIIAAMALAGGFILEGLCGPLVARARTVQEVRAYARLMAISENVLSPVAALFIFVFGAITVDRAGYEFSETWLSLGMGLYFVIAILAIAFLRPAANKLNRMAHEAPDGPVTPEITAQLKQPAPTIVGPITTVLFIFVIYLMVARPAW